VSSPTGRCFRGEPLRPWQREKRRRSSKTAPGCLLYQEVLENGRLDFAGNSLHTGTGRMAAQLPATLQIYRAVYPRHRYPSIQVRDGRGRRRVAVATWARARPAPPRRSAPSSTSSGRSPDIEKRTRHRTGFAVWNFRQRHRPTSRRTDLGKAAEYGTPEHRPGRRDPHQPRSSKTRVPQELRRLVRTKVKKTRPPGGPLADHAANACS